mmetsp:Transcript_107859/g.336388  ORF Transcript_107859/g.336388 Transcript_107859/m.336388 type:complete len:226 (+) Transcript_107859:484-1161(+)
MRRAGARRRRAAEGVGGHQAHAREDIDGPRRRSEQAEQGEPAAERPGEVPVEGQEPHLERHAVGRRPAEAGEVPARVAARGAGAEGAAEGPRAPRVRGGPEPQQVHGRHGGLRQGCGGHAGQPRWFAVGLPREGPRLHTAQQPQEDGASPKGPRVRRRDHAQVRHAAEGPGQRRLQRPVALASGHLQAVQRALLLRQVQEGAGQLCRREEPAVPAGLQLGLHVLH